MCWFSLFQPSAYVFPGGVKSEADFSPRWNNLLEKFNHGNERYKNIVAGDNKYDISNSTHQDKTSQHGLASTLGQRICALRETFEESGILIANDDNGKDIVLSNPNEHIGGEFSTLGEWRSSVYKDPSKFYELFR